jgi:hypothetical protein
MFEMADTTGQALVEDDESLELFLYSQRLRLGYLRRLFTLAYDVEGGVEAGQFGLAVEQARAAVHAAMDLTVINAVGASMVNKYNRQVIRHERAEYDGADSFSVRWRRLQRIWRGQPTLLNKLWDLECELPRTDAESLAYISRCKHVITEDMGYLFGTAQSVVTQALRDRCRATEALSQFSFGRWDTMRVFGVDGPKAASEVDRLQYVSEYYNRLFDKPMG